MFEVTFETPDGEIFETGARRDDYLIAAAARAGLEVPSSCLQGRCLSCACRVLDGEFDAGEARRFYEVDRQDEFVLICSTYPRSDLHLLTHQREAMRRHREAHDLPAPDD